MMHRVYFSLGILVLLSGFILYIVLIQVTMSGYVADYKFKQSQEKSLPIVDRLELLSLAIQHRPRRAEYYDHLGILHAKRKENDIRNFQVANNFFKTAIELDPIDFKFQLHLAVTIYKIDHDLESYFKKFEIAKKLNPYHPAIVKLDSDLSEYRN